MSNVAEVETPAPSKTEIMDTKTIAQQYDSWAISAIDLENLRQTDPLKYQEAKAEIERKRVIDAINQNQEDFLNTYKSMFDSYVSKWEELTSSDEWKNLRSEIFAKYWLDESNEKIKNYTTQIDDVEEQLDNLVNYEWTGSALGDRGELIRKQRDLTKQRMDLVKTRAAELDYYRLWLEQADAVVSDYKEYQKQELDMLWKKFEMMTGMSTMEFEMEQTQLANELKDIDTYIAKIATSKAEELKYQRELEAEEREFNRDVYMEDLKWERDIAKAMKMAEVDFGYDVQLKWLDFNNQIALNKFDAQTKLWLLRATKELDMMYPEYWLTEIDIDGVKTPVAYNKYNPTDFKTINPWASKDYLKSIWSWVITSRWGKHDNKQGIDIDGKIGDPIPSIWWTVVKVVSWKWKSNTPSYWNYVDIKDANWYIHRYAHMNNIYVNEWDSVPRGVAIWEIGNSWYTIATWWGDGSHLDYSVKRADWSWLQSVEIPWYLSTTETPKAVPQPVEELLWILQTIKPTATDWIPWMWWWFRSAVWFKWFWTQLMWLVTWKTEEGLPIWSKAAWFAKRVEQAKNILAFDNLDKLKWAMSDKDLQFLKNINTSLSIDMAEEDFEKEIERVENMLLTKYSTTLPEILKLPDFDKIEEVKPSSYLSLQK